MANFSRLWKILFVFTRYRLDSLVPTQLLPLGIRILLWLAPWRLSPVPESLTRGERLRLALEALGPIFIKFGQILSTRPDLIPADIADELKRLQDNVPPFPSQQAIALIEQQLGKPIAELFAEFETTPLASASIAQVHAARLFNEDGSAGKNVVVKVVRPGIENTIERDLQLLETMARMLVKYSADGRRLRPLEVVEDYRNTIYGELNLQVEAANTTQIRRSFANSEMIYLPEVHWEYTRTKVMVSERIYGIPVADIDAIKAQGTNIKLLAERGVEIFFTQVFRDSFFHADMHPGNIFVSREHPENPQYIAIDCGIVGSLTKEDQTYLAMNMLAFFNRDYEQVAQLHVDSGWVPPTTKVHELAAAVRAVLEPIFEKPLSEISFGQVLIQLFTTARRFNMEVQPQLVLLQKTLLNIEGLGRQLYPELDLWSTAKPFLERWLRDRFGPKAAFKELKRQLPSWIEKAPQMPNLVHGALTRLNHLDETQNALRQEIQDLREELAQQRQQRSYTALSLALFGAGFFSWWQAFALGIPEAVGIALAGAGFFAFGHAPVIFADYAGALHIETVMTNYLDELKWDANGLIPAIAQDYKTGQILMMAWMNRESLELSVKEQRAIYYSRSRQKLWRKGEESGHIQKLHDIRTDCDSDVITLQVEQLGGIACHTGRASCFYKKLDQGQWVAVEPVLKDPHEIY